MGKIFQRLILLLVVLAAIFVASCALQASQRTRALGKVAVGDTQESVIARLGQPSRNEPRGQPYKAYASQGCIAPCVVRLWWEWPVFHGIEAWSVELGTDHRVLQTSHWVSP
jgi:hypothetical protein